MHKFCKHDAREEEEDKALVVMMEEVTLSDFGASTTYGVHTIHQDDSHTSERVSRLLFPS
eukprot:2014216-Ditylum_brightwellii.AAC.1